MQGRIAKSDVSRHDIILHKTQSQKGHDLEKDTTHNLKKDNLTQDTISKKDTIYDTTTVDRSTICTSFCHGT